MRAGGSGLVLRGGYVVAQWGDVERPEMVFSVVKSVLATVAGVAIADGRIASIDDRVARNVPGPWFTGGHNGAITWRHLLEQTSDWRGTLWAVADWADRPTGASLRDWQNVLREPLPVVLRERITDPIDASSTPKPDYGLLWWLHTDRKSLPAAPASAFWAVGFGISRNHPLLDGNKRTSLVIAELFLELNGSALTATDAQCVTAFLRLAAGELSEDQLADWSATNSTALA